jgi:hypothetical protein
MLDRAKNALQTFRLIKYASVHEMATMFMVPRVPSGGLVARFNFLYKPGRRCAGRE